MSHSHTPTVSPRRTRTHRAAPVVGAGGDASCWTATVQACEGDDRFVVACGPALLRARQASSCLLVPMAGDTVACIRTGAHDIWVLAVLQRDAKNTVPRVLQCRGDTRFVVSQGALQFEAPDLQLRSDRLALTVSQLSVSTETAEVVGRHLRVIGNTVKVVGSVLSTVMDRVNHFSRNYLRTTQGTDRVAATHIECEAEQLLRLQGEHALVNGTKLVKARGAQIHFG